jgi:hypothetical protein
MRRSLRPVPFMPVCSDQTASVIWELFAPSTRTNPYQLGKQKPEWDTPRACGIVNTAAPVGMACQIKAPRLRRTLPKSCIPCRLRNIVAIFRLESFSSGCVVQRLFQPVIGLFRSRDLPKGQLLLLELSFYRHTAGWYGVPGDRSEERFHAALYCVFADDGRESKQRTQSFLG